MYQQDKNEAVSSICSGETLENPEIWLAENILAYISGERFSSNIGFVQEHSK